MIIMALPVESLFSLSSCFEGFQAHSVFDYERHILDNPHYMRRGDAEHDPSFKQPIPYALIVNPRTKQVYAYERATDVSHAHESRLHGKWSWGVGGHVEQSDSGEDPLRLCLEREVLREEVSDLGKVSIRILGYINEEDKGVSAVHFAVLYLVETDVDSVSPKDKEMAKGGFVSLSELEEICASPDCIVEGWSKMAFPVLKNYLLSL